MITFKPRYLYFFLGALILLVELLSFTAYFLPEIQVYLLAASFLAAFLLSLSSLKLGLALALVELVIGSKGHLFSADIFGFSLSLRLVIWAALMLASFIFIIRQGFLKSWRQFGRSYYFWLPLLAFSAFIILAFIQGLARGHGLGDIFSDGNAWFYLSLIIPLLLVGGVREEKERQVFLKIFFLASIFLSLKTLILLFIFSHNLSFMPDVYLWVRRSGVGEITAMGGGWQRIFIQSQIYAPIAFFLTLWPLILKKVENKKEVFLALAKLSLFLAVIIVSMSRSFWLGFGLSALIIGLLCCRRTWTFYRRALLYSLGALLGAALIIIVVVKFPFPNPQAGLSAEALAARLELSGGEAALASRWALLPNLWQEIKKAPFLGQGFGATVGYYSQDPRVLAQSPDGWYRSYAFEWAYLDTWLKMGILGLAVYLAWIFSLLFLLLREAFLKSSAFAWSLAASLLFLIIVNIFTPYLNHPLGLGFLLFCSCFIKKNPL